jgi:Flp pilus assembly protein TadG
MKWFKAICHADAWCFWRDRRGLIGPVLAITATATLASAGLAVDVGNALVVKNQLQASTNAAALAGAQQIYGNIANAKTVATNYSGVPSDKNAITYVSATMATGYPQLKCFTSLSIPCVGTGVGAATANGIVVQQQATINTIFAKFVGVSTWTITTTATAAASGGNGKPLNVMFVLDTTDSMTSADATCTGAPSGATQEYCALAGIQNVLTSLTSAVDNVGLMVFPPLATATKLSAISPAQTPKGGCTTAACIELANACPQMSKGSTGFPQADAYADVHSATASNMVPYYQLISLAQGNSPVNYNSTSNGVTTLNDSNQLVTMTGIGGKNCGIYVIAGRGTYYADAILAAQAALSNQGSANSQNVIVLLSDGNGNSNSGMPTPCTAGVNAAATAKTDGTWVYALAYGASTSGSCIVSGETYTSGCAAMQAIGTPTGSSTATRFYSDPGPSGSACPNSTAFTDLVSAFQAIGYSLIPARLIPGNTT